MWNSGGLNLLDSTLIRSPELKARLENHYRANTGEELNVPLPDAFWNLHFVNDRQQLLTEIASQVQKDVDRRTHEPFGFVRSDVGPILNRFRVSFRADIFNPSLMLPMGGVQEMGIQSTFSRMEAHRPGAGGYWPTPSKHRGSYVLGSHVDQIITLQIILRDWFGVEEDDFAASDWLDWDRFAKTFVTWSGRDELLAFWIL